MRSQFPNPGNLIGLRGPHHKHQLVGSGPGLCFLNHRFKQLLRLIINVLSLKIGTAGVARQCQQNDPLTGIIKERQYRIVTHIRGHRDGIEVEACCRRIEESTGVKARRVADVAALGIGNGETIFRDVVQRFLQTLPAAWPLRFIERNIGFVGHGIGRSGIDNGFVEFKNRVGYVNQMRR